MRAGLRFIASAYCWVFLSTSTIFWVFLGSVVAPFVGNHRGFSWILKMWAHSNMVGGLFRCRVIGEENLAVPGVLICNHRSIFDICLLSHVVPRPFYFVAREGVLKVPLIGRVLRKGGHVLVRRETSRANEPSLEQAGELARAGGRVIFFAEGSRSDDGSTGRFRSGGFRVAEAAGRPLIPVALVGTEHSVGKGSGFIIPSRMLLQVFQPRVLQPGEGSSRQIREDIRQQIAAAVERYTPENGPRV